MLIGLSSLTGAIMVILWYGIGLILERIGFANIVFELLKMVVLFFLLPIAYVGLQVYIAHLDSGHLFSPTPTIVRACERFVLLWAIGAVLVLLYIIHDYSKLRRISRNSFECSKDSQELFRELTLELLQGKSRLQIRQSYQNTTPYVEGLPTPRIVLPVADYTQQELRVILVHEMMHYKQKDLWLKLAMQVVLVFHYFNPLAWVLLFKIQKWSEFACDLKVAEYAGGIKPYFEVLISVMMENTLKTSLASHLVTNQHELKERAKKLVRISKMKKRTRLCMVMVLCTAFLFSSTTVCAATVECAEAYVSVEERTSVEHSQVRTVADSHRVTMEYGDTPGIICVEGEVENKGRATEGFSWEVPAGYRVYGPWFGCTAGQELATTLLITPTNVTIRLGIEDERGYRYYVEDMDNIYQIFDIANTRKYRVYVQNDTTTDVSVDGSYILR